MKKILAAAVLLSSLTGGAFGYAAGYVGGRMPTSGAAATVGAPEAAVADDRADAAAEAQSSDEERRIAVVEKASPAVVSIVISKNVPVYERYYSSPFGDNEFFNRFFGNVQVPQVRQKGTELQEVGAGTGFIVSADGYVVTNRHVVDDEEASYTVIFEDGEKFDGKVLARDTASDVAVVKIEQKDGKPFPFVEYGDSSSLKVGQSVVAIGYALGRFGNSVSNGIVAGLQRSIEAGDGRNFSENLYDVIQTDAAINPGNSGGPLLDLHGRAIGVNVAIVQGSQNIGFSLPINDVRTAVESVQKTGKIARPFLGVRYQVVTEELRDKNQLSVDYGMLVARGADPSELAVMPGSPADLAGIEENDILLEADGRKLTEDLPLAAVMGKYGVGDEVTFTVLRKGEKRTVKVTLSERK